MHSPLLLSKPKWSDSPMNLFKIRVSRRAVLPYNLKIKINKKPICGGAFRTFPAVTVIWMPRVSFAILRLVISRKSWVNFSAVLNSDFISREHLRALLVLILPVAVNHNDCLQSFCCCFGAAGTPDLRGHAAQLHRVFRSLAVREREKKCCRSSSFTMSSKPDTSALKQIPEGGVLLWLQSHPAGSAVCQTFSNSSSGETKKNPHSWNLSEASFFRLQGRAAISGSAEIFCRAAACRTPPALPVLATCLSELSNSSHCS